MRGHLGVVLVLAAGPALAQQDFSKVEVTSQKLTEGIYMLQGAGGNIGLSIGEDSAFLVDDQYAPLTPKIVAAVKALTDKPVKFVLNTHWHSDHSGGNENLGAAGTLIVAHDNVRLRMSTEQFMAFFDMKVPAAPKVALPVVTFNDTVTFHINGDELHAFHVPPAHTDGDSVVHFRRADVIHTGDLFFNGFYPFIDVDSGGAIEGMIGAADRMLGMARDTTKIIPGHGPLATRADLEAYRDMLVGLRDAMKPLVDSGKTLEQATAARPFAAFDPKWGAGFIKPEQMVALVYKDLSRGRKKQ
jgi:glyoxylase-like metal-dependent hydrolase (beta-lactamase superfamily II)